MVMGSTGQQDPRNEAGSVDQQDTIKKQGFPRYLGDKGTTKYDI